MEEHKKIYVTADTIFINGNIITMAEKQKTAEALAVKNGKILFIGTNEEALHYASHPDSHTETKVVDMEGKTVMPGFVEPHTHPAAAAALYNLVDISGFTHNSFEEVVQTLKQAAKNLKPNQWLIAFGYDPGMIDDLKALNSKMLDENISKDNPIIIIYQSMHTYYANSAALKAANITDSTPDPAGGGKYEKDADGHLTGKLMEAAAAAAVMKVIPQASSEDGLKMLFNMMKEYAKKGITTIGIPGLIPSVPNAQGLMDTITDFDPIVRIGNYLAGNMIEGEYTDKPHKEDDFYKELGIKYWIDGSPYTGSMLLYDNYLENDFMQNRLGCPTDNAGSMMYSKDDLIKLCTTPHKNGNQVAVHAQGDKAVDDLLEVYETLLKNEPREDHRHRMEHLLLPTEKALKKAADLGVTVSFHINHIYFYGEVLRDHMVGPERAEKMLPMNSALKLGHKVTLHTDSPMFPPNPLLTVQTAVTRKTKKGAVIGKDEAISVDDALKAITINCAWQLFMENEVGSLEVGKHADLVVLEESPYEVDPDKLGSIGIIKTYLRGEPVYT